VCVKMAGKKIDLKNLTFISEHEVPVRVRRGIPWDKMFNAIPKGQALVVQSDVASASSVRDSLRRLQKQGKFKQLYVTVRKNSEKKYVAYVVNPSKTDEQKEKDIKLG